MPRRPRLLVSGATYHVYCRVARGEFVFNDDFEAMEFVETLPSMCSPATANFLARSSIH